MEPCVKPFLASVSRVTNEARAKQRHHSQSNYIGRRQRQYDGKCQRREQKLANAI